MADNDGWLRRTVHVTLIIGLVFQVYKFGVEVSENDIGVSLSSSWEDRVTYPSVTICPTTVQQSFGDVLSVSSRDWLTFFQHKMYLENG